VRLTDQFACPGASGISLNRSGSKRYLLRRLLGSDSLVPGMIFSFINRVDSFPLSKTMLCGIQQPLDNDYERSIVHSLKHLTGKGFNPIVPCDCPSSWSQYSMLKGKNEHSPSNGVISRNRRFFTRGRTLVDF
jgi:hypothetical protein